MAHLCARLGRMDRVAVEDSSAAFVRCGDSTRVCPGGERATLVRTMVRTEPFRKLVNARPPPRAMAEQQTHLLASPQARDAAKLDGTASVDSELVAAGGFGFAQLLIMALAISAWIVHGAQVMSMAFVAPAAAQEFSDDATAVRLTGSFFFLGWLIGLSLWGRLSSQRGWLTALCWIEVCVAVAGCATALSGSGRSFLATRFLCGFAEGGVPTTSFGWAGEFFLPQHKPRAGIALQVGFLIGSLLVTSFAYYHTGRGQWRALSAIVSAAALPIALLALVAPESPRWLRRAGQKARAGAVLRWIASLNGQRAASAMPSAIEMTPNGPANAARKARETEKLRDSDGDGEGEGDEKTSILRSMLAEEQSNKGDGGSEGLPAISADDEAGLTPRSTAEAARPKPELFAMLAADSSLRQVLGILCLHWFVYSALFFGLSLHGAHDISGALITNLLQIPGVISVAFAFDRIGRRTTMLILLSVASFSCAALAVLMASFPAGEGPAHAHAALSTLGSVCMSASFAGGYIVSSELLPTEVRPVGLALCSQCSRIGGFFSPFALLFEHAAIPYSLWAILALAGGLSTLRLPETLGEPSLETMDDLHALLARKREPRSI